MESLMKNVTELYETRVRPLVPAERLQLARLILDDLAPAGDGVDVSDEWSDEDLKDVATFSMQSAARRTNANGTENAAG
jgi:hypothetical protein